MLDEASSILRVWRLHDRMLRGGTDLSQSSIMVQDIRSVETHLDSMDQYVPKGITLQARAILIFSLIDQLFNVDREEIPKLSSRLGLGKKATWKEVEGLVEMIVTDSRQRSLKAAIRKLSKKYLRR